MPYIRLYSRDIPVDEKRSIAEKLIAITLQTFHLGPEQRDQITVQFVPRHPSWAVEEATPNHSRPSDVLLEISDHDLTVEKITAFVEAAEPVLTQSTAVSASSRIARMFGVRVDPSRQVTFQFIDMSTRARNIKAGDHFATIPFRNAA